MSRVCTQCGRIITTGTRCSAHPATTRSRSKKTFEQQRRLLALATHCALCLQHERIDDRFVIDHIVPLARGGHDAPSNWQAAHRSCNARKGANLELHHDRRNRGQGSDREPQTRTLTPPSFREINRSHEIAPEN